MRTRSLALHALRSAQRSPLALRGGGRAASSQPTMALAPLATSAKVFGAFNAAGLGVSLATNSHVHLDLIGTGAFAFAAAATRGPATAARATSTAMVVGWASRLAGFLFFRACLTGRDGRLEDTLSTAGGCVGFWTISWAWGFLTMLPHALGATAASTSTTTAKFARRAGVAAFALGLATEVLADAQKFLFKRSNPGALCDVGVWGVSQHPNWFGNLCLWSGVFLYNAPGLAPAKLALSALSPLSLGALFYAQGSGALTPTVALARAKYGGDPAYAAYLAATPMLLPNPAAWIGALLRGVVGKW